MQELRKFSVKGNYKESIIYDVHGLSVSVWETVFKSESLQTFNYWTNGVMTSNKILIKDNNGKVTMVTITPDHKK